MRSILSLSLSLFPLFCHAQNGQLPVSADYRYKAATVTNPGNGYHLHCGHTGACEMAQVTIKIPRGTTPAVTDFAGITLSGRSSARDATIKIENDQGSTLSIAGITCSGYNSCVNTQFITGYDVALMSLTCAPGACIGCEVKFDESSPGIPCAPEGSEGMMPAAPPLTPAPVMVVTPSPTMPLPTPAPTVPTPVPTMPLPPTPAPTVPTPVPTVRTLRTPAPVLFVRTPSPTVPVPVIKATPSPTTPRVVMVTPRPTAPVTPPPTPRYISGNLNPAIPPLPSSRPTPPPSPTTPPTLMAPPTPRPTMPLPPTPAPTMPTPQPTMPTPAPTVRQTTASPTVPRSPITNGPLTNVREFVCHGNRLCAGQSQQIVNPQNGFYLFCTDFACTNTQFTIDVQPASGPGAASIDSFFGFLFQGDSAAAGAIVTVNNWQSGITDLGTITCSGVNACADTQIIMGYQTSIKEVNCGPGSCPNCVIKTTLTSQPWPCDPSLPFTPTTPSSNGNVPSPNVPAPVPVNPAPVPAPAPVAVPAVNVGLPAGTEVLTSPRNLDCRGSECATRNYRVNNPLNAFYLYCGDFGSCRGSNFNLWYTGTGYTRMDKIECKGEESCKGMTLRMNNNQRRDVVELNQIVCDSKSACAGATFDVGYEVAVGSVECKPDSCSGCQLIVGGVSYPCDPQQA